MKRKYTVEVFVEYGHSDVYDNIIDHYYLLSYIDRDDNVKYLLFQLKERLETGHPLTRPLNIGYLYDCNLEATIISKSSVMYGGTMHFHPFSISELLEDIKQYLITSYRRQDRKAKKKRRNRGRQYLNSFRWD